MRSSLCEAGRLSKVEPRLSYKLLNRQMFMTGEFTKYVWNTRAEEVGLDYEPFCEACEMFAPLVTTAF